MIETERAGKCHALNLGYRAADPDAPIVCLDADLEVTAEALASLLAPLQDGTAQAACGQMDVETSGVAPAVRIFYEGWRTNPYFAQGKFGWPLRAVARWGGTGSFPLPDVTADDEYIRRSFAPHEIAFVPGCRFRSPARRGRSRASCKCAAAASGGARDVARMGKASPERGSALAMLRRAVVSPAEALPVAVFLLLSVWVRLSLLLDRGASRWERDATTRVNG